MMAADAIARALGGKKSGNEHRAFCPVHEPRRDGRPSLMLRDEGGQVLVHCHGGCTNAAVIAALVHMGLWPRRQDARRSIAPRPIVQHKPERSTTAAYAAALWARAVRDDAAVAAHPYAQRKGVRHACGAGIARVSGRIVGEDAECIAVPIRLGGVGAVASIQAINADGAKQTFGPMADAFLLLGDERDPHARWFVVEGWATANALQALYRPDVTCISFGKSRLSSVADSASRLFGPDRIEIAAETDDD